MARAFVGTGYIALNRGAVSSFPFGTMVAVMRQTSGGSTFHSLCSVRTASSYQFLFRTDTQKLTLGVGAAPDAQSPLSLTIAAADGWCLVAVTKATGTVAPRFHKYSYSTGTWQHADSAVTIGNGNAGTPTELGIGAFNRSVSMAGADIAAAAMFSSRVLTDADIEQLPYSLTSWLSLAPDAMWVLDQSATTQKVVDWTGGGANEIASSAASISTSSVPILGYGHPVILPTTAVDPWLHKTSGVAARNGTITHIIPFGFSSTSGNLLVFVVFGAVTHTAVTWTEQLAPVNSGELSVFTKTSAGDNSITVTHNGSNYPVTWAVYEFPAGSTYTGGNSSTPSADTFPALSGLPGTEQLIIAARGRTSVSTGNTAMTSVWPSPWVIDAELIAPYDSGLGTHGAGLNIAHQRAFTATSITPSATTTYSGGTWSTPDREHAVFAIELPSGGGPVTVNADAALAVTATLSTAAAASKSAGASLAVTATATTAAAGTKPGAGALAVTSTLTAAATRTRNADAALAVTATLAAAATTVKPAAAALAVTAGLTAAASATKSTAAALSITATLTADPAASGATAAAALPVTATLTAAATPARIASAALAITATLATGATSAKSAAAALAVTATLAADAIVGTAPVLASAALAVTATLATAATRSTEGTTSLVVTATLAGSASRTSLPAAALAVTATLAGDATVGTPPITAAASLAAAATLIAGANRSATSGASLSVTATLASAAGRTGVAGAALSVTATLTAGSGGMPTAAAALAILATIIASASTSGRVTYRPFTGTTPRPYAGTTPRL